MSVATIESELTKMSDAERMAVIGVAKRLMKNASRDQKRSVDQKRAQLRISAETMKDEYTSNKSLIEMTLLDSEDFLNA